MISEEKFFPFDSRTGAHFLGIGDSESYGNSGKNFMRFLTGVLPKCRSATGPRSQRLERERTRSILANFHNFNALRTGTVRAPFEIQSFGQHAITPAG